MYEVPNQNIVPNLLRMHVTADDGTEEDILKGDTSSCSSAAGGNIQCYVNSSIIVYFLKIRTLCTSS